MKLGWGRTRWVAAVVAVGVALTVAVTASGSSGKSSGAGPSAGAAAASKCGLGNGKKATGSPIVLGGLATKQPGTDFTDITNMAAAYFACVNANGGIYNHRIVYKQETEQTNPTQLGALSKKLVQTDKVLGIVGNTSILDCTINHAYYESKGFYVIDSGIAPECYSTSHSAAVNMGPRYSSDGAVQAVISLAHPSKIVFDQSNVPGTGYILAGPQAVAKAAHVPITGLTENVPITDANSVATKEVQQAGSSGAVVLNFTPPQALVILQAAQKLGLENRVKAWGCSTPCNTDFLAGQLGPAWNGKLFVNAELNLPAASGPDSALYRSVLSKYGKSVSGGAGSFSQMGFTEARIATTALLSIKSKKYTVHSVNAAFKSVKTFKTDILCKPWYYGPASLHIPNNTDRTVTPSNGHMVQKQACFAISAADPQIAAVRKVEAKGQT